MRRDYWVLWMVVLAYLPDIAAQCLHTAGVPNVSSATHSVGFALVSAPLAGWLLARFRLARPGFATLVALCSVLIHVLLDLLQGTDRAVLWPFISHRISMGFAVIPGSLSGEAAAFGVLFAAFQVWPVTRVRELRAFRLRRGPAFCIALIVALAVATHAVRGQRERQLRGAQRLVEKEHDYVRALALLDDASRWPSPAKPGRIDYLRAGALLGLGDRAGAEQAYLRSFNAAPDYFWLVADIAAFYADADLPRDERSHRVRPYLERLRAFAPDPRLPEELRRIDVKMRAGR